MRRKVKQTPFTHIVYKCQLYGWHMLFIAFSFIPSVSSAQGKLEIHGTILDEDNQPVPYATVLLGLSTDGAVCNEEGMFTLATYKRDRLSLHISSVGYDKKVVEITPASSASIEIVEQLNTISTLVQQVDVKAENKCDSIEQRGFAVSSVDTRKLQSISIELNDVLDRVPGVRVRRNGGLGSIATYNINGLSGRSVRIFIDGVPAESMGSSFSINSIPISLIERVDVYKGVVPIEFGNDAMGGVINVVTKNHNHNNFNASYSFGSFNTHRADFNGAYRNKKSGLTSRLSIFYNHTDNDYEVWSDDIKIKDYNQFLPDGSRNPDYSTVIEQGIRVRRFNDVYTSYGVKADFGITSKPWVDELFGTITFADAYKELQHGPRMITPYGERFYTDKTGAVSMRYAKKNLFLDGLNVSANLQYSLSHLSLIDTTTLSYDWNGNTIPPVNGVEQTHGESGTPSLNVDDNTNYIGRITMSYNISEKHMLQLNYAYNLFVRRSDDAMQEAELRSYGSTNSVNKQISGVSYQNALFSHKLRTSVFAKNYYNNIRQNKVELINSQLDTVKSDRPSSDWGFGATLSYKLNSRIRINASVEKALRLVSTNEVFGNISSEIVESPDLEPEKSINLNLGGTMTLLNEGSHKIEFNTNLFFRDTYDRIRRNVIVRNDDSYSVFENIGHVNSKGVEAQLDYRIGQNWYFMVQGYYLDSRFLEKFTLDGSQNLNYKSREPNMPWLTSKATISKNFISLFDYNDRLSFSWYFSYIHAFYFDWDVLGNQNKPLVPRQIQNDISVSYQFGNQRLTLSVDARNLFDQMAFDNYSIQKPGRALYGKLSYRFF